MKSISVFLLLALFNVHLYSQKFNSEILSFLTEINISEKNILTENISYVIIINNRGGEDMCNVSVPYSAQDPVTELNAHIEDLDGNIIKKLKKKDIVDRSSISDISLYEDDYVKTFTLLHNVYPYKLVYSYTYEYSEFFHITIWNPVIDFDYPTHHAQLNMSIPKDYKISIFSKNLQEAEKQEADNKNKYTWKAKYDGNYKYENYSPHYSNYISYLKIFPLEFNMGVPGKQDTWKSLGKWKYDLNKGLDDLTFSEKAKIDALIKSSDEPKERIIKLYKYMQDNTRYINVSVDIGGFKSYPATYVCENKYGDCKALTNYMKSMLKYVGIQSYFSTIRAGINSKKIDVDLPSNQFNHVILFVPLENDTMWLECTSKYNPPGYLGTFTQGRYALIVKETGGELIKTPELDVDDVKIERKMNISFNNQSAEIDIRFIFRGYAYERLLQFSNLLTEDQKKEYIHNYIPFTNYEIDNWEIKKFKDQAFIELNLKINKRKYLEEYEDIKFTALYPTSIPNFEKPNKRKKAVILNYPRHISDSFTYNYIENYNVKSLNDTIIKAKFGEFEITSKVEKNSLIVNKNFILYSGEYPIEEYKSFYNFLNSVKSIERKNPIVYNKN